MYPLHFIAGRDKAIWFGEFCEWCRYATLQRLHGIEPITLREEVTRGKQYETL